MRRYLIPGLRPGPWTLEGDEALHLVRVNRARVGERVLVFDGAGHEAEAEVVALDRERHAATLTIGPTRALDRGLPAPLELYLAPPRGERMDRLVRALTELGASRIAALTTDRGFPGHGERQVARWTRIAREALKQCGRNRPPEIQGGLDLLTSLSAPPPGALRAVARPGAAEPLLRLLQRQGAAGSGMALWIGPEGGWAPAEEARFAAASIPAFGLGPAILRVETAALTAAALAQQVIVSSALPEPARTL